MLFMVRIKGLALLASWIVIGCSSDGGSAAVRRGVGAACSDNSGCQEAGQVCLTQFKGGMCGIADCTTSTACPAGSLCVSDPDLARNFCLLTCDVKADCNVHRAVDTEANCSSTLNAIDPPVDGGVDGGSASKICRPPNA